MKTMKKVFALVLSLALIFALSATAFAADGTITVKNATKGHTYTAYKVFDATYDGTKVSYKTAAENVALLDDTLFGWSAADADGNISVWALDGAAEADILDWVEANYDDIGGTAITGVFDDENSTVTFSGLDYGYYYITSSLGATVTIDTVAPTAVVYDKNVVEPTQPVKTIIAIDGEAANKVTEANAHVGSVVTFEVTANTVNWQGEGENAVLTQEFSLIDTATGMFIDPETIVVKVNGTEITNYVAAGDGNGGMTLNIPMVDENNNSIYDAPADGLIPIEITYDAVILEAAADAPAENEVGGPPVVVYTYAFQIAKTDDEDQPLPGAEFELWSDGAALTFIDNGDGTYTYDPSGAGITTLAFDNAECLIVIKGLDNSWDYVLKEITVPNGYNQAADVDVAGSSLTQVKKDTDTAYNTTTLYKVTVVNQAGAELPATGGVGTTIFYIVGAILVLGAGVLLVTRRRMNVQ